MAFCEDYPCCGHQLGECGGGSVSEPYDPAIHDEAERWHPNDEPEDDRDYDDEDHDLDLDDSPLERLEAEDAWLEGAYEERTHLDDF